MPIYPNNPNQNKYTSSWWDTMRPIWEMIYSVYYGDLIFKGRYDRNANTEYEPNPTQRKYLLRSPHETDGYYRFRSGKTSFYNLLALNVDAHMGFIFQGNLFRNVKPEYQYIFDQVTVSGQSIEDFAQEVFRDSFLYGYTHIFVDAPNLGPRITLEDVNTGRFRAYMKHVPVYQLYYATNDEFGRPTHYEFFDSYTEAFNDPAQDNPAGFLSERERVFSYQVSRDGILRRTYRPDPNLITPLTDRGSFQLMYKLFDPEMVESVERFPLGTDELPLITVRTVGEHNEYIIKPHLFDLASKNLEHYNSSSEQNLALGIARNESIVFIGASDDEIENIRVKSGKIITLENPDAKAQFLGASGVGMDAGFQDLRRIEEHICNLSLDLMRPTVDRDPSIRQGMSANVTVNKLEALSVTFFMHFNNALEVMLNRMNLTVEQVVEDSELPLLSTKADFKAIIMSETFNQYLELARVGSVSINTLANMMSNLGFYPKNMNPDEEFEKLATERERITQIEQPPQTEQIQERSANE